MFGKPLVVSNVKLLIVISRPRITILSFATRTKRFIRWKKSARSKKLPSNSKSSGTLSRPGAGGPAADGSPEAGAAPPPAAPDVAFALFTALPAVCAAWPGPLAAGAAPGAVGPPAPPPGVAADAGAAVAVAERWPALMSVNLM